MNDTNPHNGIRENADIKEYSLDLGQAIQAVKEGRIETVRQFLRKLKKEDTYNGVWINLKQAGIFHDVRHPGKKGEYIIQLGPEPKRVMYIRLLQAYAAAIEMKDEALQDTLLQQLRTITPPSDWCI